MQIWAPGFASDPSFLACFGRKKLQLYVTNQCYSFLNKQGAITYGFLESSEGFSAAIVPAGSCAGTRVWMQQPKGLVRSRDGAEDGCNLYCWREQGQNATRVDEGVATNPPGGGVIVGCGEKQEIVDRVLNLIRDGPTCQLM